MKSKSILAAIAPTLAFAVAVGAAAPSAFVYAQERQNAEEDVTQRLEDASEVVLEASAAVEDTIEEVAEHVAEVGEEFSEALEKWMGQHSGELKHWSDEHGDQWAKWGERLERRVEKWSVDQEKQWKSWAEHYESEMGTLSKQLEKNELSPDDVSNLVETNLRLLGEIPIGEMIQQGIREGARELESAPWKSLNDLSRIAGEAATDSMEAAEKLTGSAVNRALRTSFNHSQELAEVHKKLEREFHNQKHEIQRLFERRIEALEGLLEEGGDDASAARKMIERLEEVREKKVDQLERQHDRQQQKAEAELERQKNELSRIKGQEEKSLEAKEAPAGDELRTLRHEVELLRQEVQRLQKK